ncbi:463_t:CDS:2, partial [Rhizophagus irregularis]
AIKPIFVSILLPPRCVSTVENEVQSFYRGLFKEKPNLVSSTISVKVWTEHYTEKADKIPKKMNWQVAEDIQKRI